jgi:hypothetical protein
MLRITIGAVLAAAASLFAAAGAGGEDKPGRIQAAQFDDQGRLIYPANVDEWVHLGASVGLSYREGAAFDPAHPGVMNEVSIEPQAYHYFMEHGTFADGTMFHLEFHSTVRDARLNSSGFATGPTMSTEIHLKDSEKFPDGFNFYTFANGQKAAAAVPLPNACVACHKANGEYDGTFVQFYPRILARLSQGKGE